MQVAVHKYPLKWYKQPPLRTIKNRGKKGEMGIKKGDFRGKKRVFRLEKLRAGNQNRKAKWCKMQVVFLKLA